MWLKKSILPAFPASLFARLTLVLLTGLLVAQGVSLWLQSGERAQAVTRARGQNFADRVADAVRVLEAAPAAQRAGALAVLETGGVQARLLASTEVYPNVPRGQISALIAARLGSEREIRSAGGGGGMQHGNPQRSFDVQLADGQWVRITAGAEAEAPALPGKLILQIGLSLGVIVVVVLFAVRQVSAPLQQLADAADSLGADLEAPPLPEQGSTETRRAAQAFNRMQARIRRLVDERARALAAVSHDLRTPLTRLRLRAELVEDESLREQLAGDLDAMAEMLDTTLDYLRSLQESETPRPIDMNALLQSLTEDAAVLGRKVALQGEAHSPYTGRLLALRRALQNLIDNAIKYGGCARLRVEDDALALRICVEDEGPGIPPEALARVTEPYYRLDASRSRETGGVGLGLSIVKDIALLHGGKLELQNRSEGGLSASLWLPRR